MTRPFPQNPATLGDRLADAPKELPLPVKLARRLLDLAHEIGDEIDARYGMDTPSSAEAFGAFLAESVRLLLLMDNGGKAKVTLLVGGNEIRIGGQS